MQHYSVCDGKRIAGLSVKSMQFSIGDLDSNMLCRPFVRRRYKADDTKQ